MIAHIDADAFFAAVLVRQNPRLRGKPLLALGMGGSCVISASYEAKAKGVKTGMTLKDALKLVPDALHLSSDFRETGIASHQIESILESQCPLIEQMSIDEWYLDLTSIAGGLPNDLDAWATRTREKILRDTAISVSVGVAPTKLLAKMAGEYRKPGGVTTIDRCALLVPRSNRATIQPFDATQDRRETRNDPQGINKLPVPNLQTFLQDRPAAAIPGIGRKRVIHTDAQGWHTAWDIATAPTDVLRRLFGKQGEELKRELLGESLFPVTTEHDPPQSVSRCRSFRQTRDRSLLWAHLLRHAEYTVLKMRRHSLACLGLSVWLRTNDYHHEGTHYSLPQPFDTEESLLPFVRRCLERLWNNKKSYTQVGLALWRLVPRAAVQFSLFQEPSDTVREQKIQTSLDSLHERFGRNSITRGAALQVRSGTVKDLGFSVYE